MAGVPSAYVREVLAGRPHLCRTPSTLGSDDANLDGIAAQLWPRPRVHVVWEQRWSALPSALQRVGCEQLIAIGQSPLRAPLPPEARARSVHGFGYVDVIDFPN